MLIAFDLGRTFALIESFIVTFHFNLPRETFEHYKSNSFSHDENNRDRETTPREVYLPVLLLEFYDDRQWIATDDHLEVVAYPSCSKSIVRFSCVCCLIRSRTPRARVRRGLGTRSARRFVYTSSSLCRGIFFTNKQISFECAGERSNSVKWIGSQPSWRRDSRRRDRSENDTDHHLIVDFNDFISNVDCTKPWSHETHCLQREKQAMHSDARRCLLLLFQYWKWHAWSWAWWCIRCSKSIDSFLCLDLWSSLTTSSFIGRRRFTRVK